MFKLDNLLRKRIRNSPKMPPMMRTLPSQSTLKKLKPPSKNQLLLLQNQLLLLLNQQLKLTGLLPMPHKKLNK
jgi:hypothetical protein